MTPGKWEREFRWHVVRAAICAVALFAGWEAARFESSIAARYARHTLPVDAAGKVVTERAAPALVTFSR